MKLLFFMPLLIHLAGQAYTNKRPCFYTGIDNGADTVRTVVIEGGPKLNKGVKQ